METDNEDSEHEEGCRRDAEFAEFKRINTPFKQQRQPCYRVTIDSELLGPLFFIIGLLYLPLGILLITKAWTFPEIKIDYTDCWGTCWKTFVLKEPFQGDFVIYYELTNFYQNHRRLAVSRDNRQLDGWVGHPRQTCYPWISERIGNKKRHYWPCGALANSMFQDEFTLYDEKMQPMELSDAGIAWTSDLVKYSNPKGWNDSVSTFWKTHIKPIRWMQNPEDLKDGVQNLDFIVWMRIAARSKFRKLHRTVVNRTFSAGVYSIKIESSFDAFSLNGTKSVIILPNALLGPQTWTIGILYIAVGAFYFFLEYILAKKFLHKIMNREETQKEFLRKLKTPS